MTTKTKRPAVHPGDLALVANVGLGSLPLFRITRLESDSDGNVTTYWLTDSANPQESGSPIEAARILGVFSNVLNQE